ncbi:MAG: NAD(P)H-dependent oxidoreductase subunit E [Marinilabiliaceae bacterium]|nr:NAD(P)H-dependent oxidoreductase subunit E [Marinilabiliaceae bacterium]
MSDVKQIVHNLTNQYGKSVESLLPILQNIMEINHVITEEAMIEVARELDISAAEVFGTATFYSFLNTSKPYGKYIIRVCKTITCMMHGKNQIIEEIELMLKIKPGETTHDRLFTLLETNCLGQCHQGPAMLINDTPYTQLTPSKVRDIINSYLVLEVSNY